MPSRPTPVARRTAGRARFLAVACAVACAVAAAPAGALVRGADAAASSGR